MLILEGPYCDLELTHKLLYGKLEFGIYFDITKRFMPRAEFQIFIIKTVLFSNGIFITEDRIPKIIKAINSRMKNLLDESAEQFPIPDDAPSEIPRIILNSTDQNVAYNIMITKDRVDLSVRYENLSSDRTVDFEDFRSKVISIAEYFIEKETVFNRIGVIQEYVSPVPGKSNDIFLSNLLKEHPLLVQSPDTLAYTLRKTDREEHENFGEINSNREITSARRRIIAPDQQYLALIYDINTLPGTKIELSIEKINNFFSIVKQEVDTDNINQIFTVEEE